MHTMWKGSISFGLVNIPIKMFAATENKDVKFRYLHKECHTPIKYVRMCPVCDRELEWNEIVKGYEYQTGEFVLFEDEELEELSPQHTKTINILDFVDLKEIDPIYFDKSYYLSPEDTGGKAYALLRKAMQNTGKIAVAHVMIRTTQTLCVIRTFEDYLVMESIFYPDEVRSTTLLPQAPAAEVDEKELQMAVQLINSLVTPFKPEQYKDEYRERLQVAIDAKIQGQELHTPHVPQQERIHDLMKALQESISMSQNRPEQQEETAKAETAPRKRRRKAE